MKIEDLQIGNILIVQSFNQPFKIEIIDISEKTIMYKNLDTPKAYSSRVTKGYFERTYKIIEKCANLYLDSLLKIQIQ